MAAPQSFRSAFNGFNREDVVHYIEYINSKHTTEVNQLKSDVDALQSKLSAVPETPDLTEELEALRRERDALLEKVSQLEDQIAAPTEKEQALEARCAELEAELQSAKVAFTPAVPTPQCQVSYELETYRRAERTEREARVRAEQVYHQTNSALADATAKVDAAAAQIGEMTDTVLAQLNALQAAVTGSKKALKDAAATMYTIRPNPDAE